MIQPGTRAAAYKRTGATDLGNTPDKPFKRPPTFEMALSVQTAAPFFDAYRVREVHALYEAEYPRVEHQPPFEGFTAFPIGGTAVDLSLQPYISVGVPLHSRWWFIAPEGHRLLQFQENFFAYNWRRMLPPPGQIADPYPGYPVMRDNFSGCLDRYAGFLSRHGSGLAPPQFCHISYDNLVPLQEGGNIADVLSVWRGKLGGQAIGFSANWFEPIEVPEGPVIAADFRIAVAVAGLLVDGRPRSFLRLQLIGQRPVATWEDVLGFFDQGHAHARKRLVDLVTDEVRSQWNAEQ